MLIYVILFLLLLIKKKKSLISNVNLSKRMDAYIYAFLLNKVLNQPIFTDVDVDNVELVFVNIEK